MKARVLIPTPELSPMGRTVGQRIYESIVSHIPFEQSGIPIFDEAPGEVKKSMDYDPANSLGYDRLDRAQQVIDYYGDKVDAIRVSREAAAGGSGSDGDDNGEGAE